MTNSEIQFIKKLQSTIWGAVGVLFAGMLVAGIAFYYKAGKDVEYLQRDVQRLETEKVNKELYNATIDNIGKQLENINQKLDRRIK
jgi:hypothetical protein